MNTLHVSVLFLSIFKMFAHVDGNNPKLIEKENDYIKFGKALVDFVTFRCNVEKAAIQSDVSSEYTPILLFNNGTLVPYPMPNASEVITNLPNFNINAKTTIFSHGFMGSPDESYVIKMGSLLASRGYNFLSFDMIHYLQRLDYSYVASVAENLANVLFDFLSKVHAKGLKASNIHLVGFSLGAQISGFVARKFKKVHNKTISRITGLDPAAPCFALPDALGPDDAEQVDVILTSILSYNPSVVGRTQYFVNGRYQTQPGCPSIPVFDFFCSHFRARDLFVESVENQWAFMSKKCKDINNYDCQFYDVSQMGYSSDFNHNGNFHVTTNSKYQFGKGLFGLL